ncbi:DinB family protein [Allobranchiibius huperziae]|uniref:Uncharacterized protein YciI n=1 Tax=Allobranchiibius huperziae TaxID=1874116 RepID=A0A853DAX6_9MICO|nr:DinB family protein [Allobranchiibius huperziae]NYJ74686.1 uncharacterized protein YciI [Allobranchiibius huperziae]
MTSSQDDIVELADHVWARFGARMSGLSDEEWAWCPAPETRISIRWRLGHVTDMLAQERNWTWLGVRAPVEGPRPDPVGASDAMAAAEEAYTRWRALVVRDDIDLSTAIGAPAGEYGTATRRSYVLHVIEELTHHCAESALLRDLYECHEASSPDTRHSRTSSGVATARQADPTAATTTEFAVLIGPGPAWDDALDIRQQSVWETHAKYMDGLVADGVIVLGGPLGEGEHILHFVEADDEASVRRHFSGDPWQQNGLLRIEWVRQWHLWLDGRI